MAFEFLGQFGLAQLRITTDAVLSAKAFECGHRLLLEAAMAQQGRHAFTAR